MQMQLALMLADQITARAAEQAFRLTIGIENHAAITISQQQGIARGIKYRLHPFLCQFSLAPGLVGFVLDQRQRHQVSHRLGKHPVRRRPGLTRPDLLKRQHAL